MSRPESTFWQALKPHIPGDVERIENVAGKGTPDVCACHQGVTVWLELKVADYKGEYVVRPEQKVWHRKRLINGGRVFLLVKHERMVSLQMLCVANMQYVELFTMTPRYDWEAMVQRIFYWHIDQQAETIAFTAAS